MLEGEHRTGGRDRRAVVHEADVAMLPPAAPAEELITDDGLQVPPVTRLLLTSMLRTGASRSPLAAKNDPPKQSHWLYVPTVLFRKTTLVAPSFAWFGSMSKAWMAMSSKATRSILHVASADDGHAHAAGASARRVPERHAVGPRLLADVEAVPVDVRGCRRRRRGRRWSRGPSRHAGAGSRRSARRATGCGPAT